MFHFPFFCCFALLHFCYLHMLLCFCPPPLTPLYHPSADPPPCCCCTFWAERGGGRLAPRPGSVPPPSTLLTSRKNSGRTVSTTSGAHNSNSGSLSPYIYTYICGGAIQLGRRMRCGWHCKRRKMCLLVSPHFFFQDG